MTWREKTIVRILLLIARIVGRGRVCPDELKNLDNHLGAYHRGIDDKGDPE